jgi:hypothetical protein
MAITDIANIITKPPEITYFISSGSMNASQEKIPLQLYKESNFTEYTTIVNNTDNIKLDLITGKIILSQLLNYKISLSFSKLYLSIVSEIDLMLDCYDENNSYVTGFANTAYINQNNTPTTINLFCNVNNIASIIPYVRNRGGGSVVKSPKPDTNVYILIESY